ncbi:MAG: TolC family protein [Planctomycetota bacterium]
MRDSGLVFSLGFRLRWPAGLLVGLLVVVGCANREVGPSLRTQTPPPFSEAGESPVPERWWLVFDDAGLNQQIETALGSSFSLRAARYRVRAARALARREASDLFPDVNGVADVGYGFGPGPSTESYVWGLEGSYPVDLWGEIESRVDAERLRAGAVREDYRAVALLLSAEIANVWFALIEAKSQLQLLQEQVETNETGLALQESRFGLGLIRSADVLRQRQLVESTLEQKAITKADVEVLEHQLAVLIGSMPQSATYQPALRFPKLPPLPVTGLPSELLQRRPDVRRDFLAFQAADRDLASAVADQYPRLNLGGSLLNAADHPEALFRNWFVSLGASLVAPILDGGQRKAEVARTSAVTCELFNRYGQTMLVAFQEVENGLARERYQQERLQHLEAQLELADESAERLREQYLLEPNTDYLAVLTAITGKQRLQREVLAAQLQLINIRVSLYLALAGGFDPTPLASGEGVVIDFEIDPASQEADGENRDRDENPDDANSEDNVREDPSKMAEYEDDEVELIDLLRQMETSEESTTRRLDELLRDMIDE